MYIYRRIWIGDITSFSQPDLTERISAQFLSSVCIRNRWIPQVCKLLIWGPLKFSHHNKLTLYLYIHYSYCRKDNNFIALHTVPLEQEALTNQEAIPQSFIQVFVEKWMLFKRTFPLGIVSAVVSAFSLRIMFINNFSYLTAFSLLQCQFNLAVADAIWMYLSLS